MAFDLGHRVREFAAAAASAPGGAPPRLAFSFLRPVPPTLVGLSPAAPGSALADTVGPRPAFLSGPSPLERVYATLSLDRTERARQLTQIDEREMRLLMANKVTPTTLAAARSFGDRYDAFVRERLDDPHSVAHRALVASEVVAFMRHLVLGDYLGLASQREAMPMAEDAPDPDADADDVSDPELLSGPEISDLLRGAGGSLIAVTSWKRYFASFQLLSDLYGEEGWLPLSVAGKRDYSLALAGLERIRPHHAHAMQEMPPLLLLCVIDWMRSGDDFHKELGLMALIQFQAALRPCEVSGTCLRDVDVFRSDEGGLLPPGSRRGQEVYWLLHIRNRKNRAKVNTDFFVRILLLEDDLAPFDAFRPLEAHLKRHDLWPLSSASLADRKVVMDGHWRIRGDLPGVALFQAQRRGVRSPEACMGADQLRHGVRAGLVAMQVPHPDRYSGYSLRRGAANVLMGSQDLPHAVVTMVLGHSTKSFGSTPAYYAELAETMLPGAWRGIFRQALTAAADLLAAAADGRGDQPPLTRALQRLFPEGLDLSARSAGAGAGGSRAALLAERLVGARSRVGPAPAVASKARARRAENPDAVDLKCVCQLACTQHDNGGPGEGAAAVNGFMLSCSNTACGEEFHPTCIGLDLLKYSSNAALADEWTCAACGGPPFRPPLKGSWAALANASRAADRRAAARGADLPAPAVKRPR